MPKNPLISPKTKIFPFWHELWNVATFRQSLYALVIGPEKKYGDDGAWAYEAATPPDRLSEEVIAPMRRALNRRGGKEHCAISLVSRTDQRSGTWGHIPPTTLHNPICPQRQAGSILFQLLAGTLRFNQVQRAVGEVTPRMLVNQLRELEEDGLIELKVYPQVPAKVEYSLSPLGRSMEPILLPQKAWGDANLGPYGKPSQPDRLITLDKELSGHCGT